RFGIRRTGCSGWGYTVDIADAVADDDEVFEHAGVRLLVDRKALPFVDGTEIDFRRDGLNAAFVFRNPNATGACGCGESFTVDDPACRAPLLRHGADSLNIRAPSPSGGGLAVPRRGRLPRRKSLRPVPTRSHPCVITKSCFWSIRTRASRCPR